MKPDALFDAPKVERERTSKALVPVSPLDSELIVEQALFRHGGYGADRSTTTLAAARMAENKSGAGDCANSPGTVARPTEEV